MLIKALTDHFNDYFRRSEYHDTVLWFDPGREYVALLDHLTDVPLLRYEGSLLRLRYQLVNRQEGERTVVYLPVPMDEAEVLRPFFYEPTLIFRTRLYKFLRQQGLAFPDDPQIAHKMRNLLPQLAARSIGKGRTFWEEVLQNLERVIAVLVGDPDNALLRFLAQPQAELERLREERLDELFAALVESVYGLSLAGDGAQAQARRLTVQLALVRAHTGAGQPEDFPYAAQLPEPDFFERCNTFLGQWQRDTRFKESYKRHAAAVENQYRLDRWTDALPLDTALHLDATFASVENALWRRIEKEMNSLEGETACARWLARRRDTFARRAGGFWAREGRAPGWGLLVAAADLMADIGRTREALETLTKTGDLLRHYAAHDWQVDGDYRRLREVLNRLPAGYDRLRDRCDRSYRDVLAQMNERLSFLLEEEGALPAAALPPQDRFWEGLAEQQKTAGARRRVAILMVDALRYEMAEMLRRQLAEEGAGEVQEIKARLAAIPTVTPIGMSAVLPGGRNRRVDYDDGWRITIGDSDNLAAKEARIAWLADQVDNLAVYNLEQLPQAPADELRQAQTIVVFDTTLDAVGENAGTLAWDAFSTLLHSVRRGVHQLLNAGVQEVHVITDHGFLLLDELGEHEKVSVKHVPAAARKARYVVGRHLGHTDQLRFPVPGSDGLEAWFPRGIGCFRTPGRYNYVHGGLSLQELVIPHLTITQTVVGRPVDVRVIFPDVITNAQFKVELQPQAEPMLDQPRQVLLTLERTGDGEARPLAPPLSQVVTATQAATIDVFLPMGCGLEPGDEVRWMVRDANTEEVLAEGTARSEVDLW